MPAQGIPYRHTITYQGQSYDLDFVYYGGPDPAVRDQGKGDLYVRATEEENLVSVWIPGENGLDYPVLIRLDTWALEAPPENCQFALPEDVIMSRLGDTETYVSVGHISCPDFGPLALAWAYVDDAASLSQYHVYLLHGDTGQVTDLGVFKYVNLWISQGKVFQLERRSGQLTVWQDGQFVPAITGEQRVSQINEDYVALMPALGQEKDLTLVNIHTGDTLVLPDCAELAGNEGLTNPSGTRLTLTRRNVNRENGLNTQQLVVADLTTGNCTVLNREPVRKEIMAGWYDDNRYIICTQDSDG